MAFPLPQHWRYLPSESLVVGEGPYAGAIATLLGCDVVPVKCFESEPMTDDTGGLPQVLEYLKRAVLVVSDSMSPAEALRRHEGIWRWIEVLSPAGDQHDLAFLFAMPTEATAAFEGALAVGLGLDKIDPATTGHAIWRSTDSLTGLIDLLASISPTDLLLLRARRGASAKHATMRKLRTAVALGDASSAAEAARAVLTAFSDHAYQLDIFCRPPSHRHGNLLRRWLNAGVTEPVTPDWWQTGRQQLAGWLAHDRTT